MIARAIRRARRLLARLSTRLPTGLAARRSAHAHRARLLATIVIAGMLGACGQKGPLYLPKPGATPPVASKPVPSPAAPAADPATDSGAQRPLR